jgi:hypothetical protein
MNKFFLIILLLTAINKDNQHEIVIDSSLKTSSTHLIIKIKNKEREILKSSTNSFKSDTLLVTFSNVGKEGTAFQIKISDKIEPKLFLWSDYGQYEGKSSVEIELDEYSLILNKDKLKLGDTLTGKIHCKSLPSKFIPNDGFIELEGDLFGIIGKLIIVRKNNSVSIIDNTKL